MRAKNELTRMLLDLLPPEDQARMARDVILWLCADLQPAERQQKVEKLAPRLLARIRQGQLGLKLIVYYHLLRVPPLSWLDRGRVTAQEGINGQVDWMVAISTD